MKAITFITITFFVFFISIKGFSQSLKEELVYLNINRSLAGTGDMKGYFANVDYQRFIKKKLFWYLEFGANSHYKENGVTYKIDNNPEVDASLRIATSGMQIGSGIGISPIKTYRHQINMQGGAILRFQARSNSSVTYLFVPTDLQEWPKLWPPVPVFSFENYDKGQTLTVGYKINARYQFFFAKKLFLGVNGFIQNDTDGDIFSGYGLNFGKKF
ncbi:MAG: hypothetical protein IPH58_03315 [Sphingobacteriales bacterium]|jgi:hypothetical protein|nr:hypothetical protein [Sphingobacteriales bacterium]